MCKGGGASHVVQTLLDKRNQRQSVHTSRGVGAPGQGRRRLLQRASPSFCPVTQVLAFLPLGQAAPFQGPAPDHISWGWLPLGARAHSAALQGRELLARRWWQRRLRAIVPSADPALLASAAFSGLRPSCGQAPPSGGMSPEASPLTTRAPPGRPATSPRPCRALELDTGNREPSLFAT